MTVLVLTRAADPTADLVIAELNRRDTPVVRLNPADFPEALRATARIGPRYSAWEGELRGQHRDVVLDQVRSVYYRRPTQFRLNPGLSGHDAKWAFAEARAGLGGLLGALDCLWVNHPDRNAVAGGQPQALAAAVRCGLAVPDTLITNDPGQARAFITGLPGGIAAYKALGTTGPSGTDGEPAALWTTQVRAAEVDDSVALTAHLFQEWITKAFDVRLTVVGELMFAAEIHTTSPQAMIDVRTDYASHTYRPCQAPPAVAAAVRRMMAEFQLRYAAIDFLVDQNGKWTMNDFNPNGQWAFIPELREPITHALADLLEGNA